MFRICCLGSTISGSVDVSRLSLPVLVDCFVCFKLLVSMGRLSMNFFKHPFTE